MDKSKGFIITGSGIMLKAILSVLLKITGETATSGAVTKVINFIVIICCIIGVINTIKAYKDEGLGKALAIQAVIITVGFFLSRILVWAIIIGVVIAVIWFFTGDSVIIPGLKLSGAPAQERSQVNINAEENEERRKRMQEEIHRTTGIPMSDIHVNSDGSKYFIGDSGEWNNLSRDGNSFEDNDGNWHNFT